MSSSYLEIQAIPQAEFDLQERGQGGRQIEHTSFWPGVSWAFEAFAASPLLVVAVFTLLYFIPTLWIAAHKLLWDDEFFTLYISATSGWHEIIRALSTGADQHPPTFYYLTHLFLTAFGTSHITIRLPEMVSYWAMCVFIYLLVKRWFGNIWGVVGIVMPLAFWGLYYYASEARGYGLVLGFSALAFYSWVQVTEGRRRLLFLLLLATGVACATASHYYAVLVPAALGGAELVRTGIRRRVDWPVWLAFAATIVPPLLFLKVIRSSQGYSSHFWAKPKWRMMYDFHPHMMGYFPNLVLGVAAVGFVLLAIPHRTEEKGEEPVQLPVWIVAAVLIFALLPVLVMLLAKTVTHGYMDRYAIPAGISSCILCTYALRRLSGGRRSMAIASILLALFSYGFNVYISNYSNALSLDDLADDRYFLSHERPADPLVVNEITVFHRLAFYGPPKTRDRMTYIADPTAATQYLGFDTIDRGLLDLRPWFPLNVVPASEYVRAHSSFVSYGYIGDWTWISFDLAKPNVETRLVARRKDRVLFSVQNATALLPDLDAAKPEYLKPGLYDKFKGRRESLCAIYMGAKNCPSL